MLILSHLTEEKRRSVAWQKDTFNESVNNSRCPCYDLLSTWCFLMNMGVERGTFIIHVVEELHETNDLQELKSLKVSSWNWDMFGSLFIPFARCLANEVLPVVCFRFTFVLFRMQFHYISSLPQKASVLFYFLQDFSTEMPRSGLTLTRIHGKENCVAVSINETHLSKNLLLLPCISIPSLPTSLALPRPDLNREQNAHSAWIKTICMRI